jgi:hypothetical protein
VSRAGAQGSLQAWRDQPLFKVAFAWGLRRAEVAMLDRGITVRTAFGIVADLNRGGLPSRTRTAVAIATASRITSRCQKPSVESERSVRCSDC